MSTIITTTNTRPLNPILTARQQLPREIRLGQICFYEGTLAEQAEFALEILENFEAAYVPSDEGDDSDVVMTCEGEIDMGPCLNL